MTITRWALSASPSRLGVVLLLWLVGAPGVVDPAAAQGPRAPGATAEEKAAAKREGQVTYYTARATAVATSVGREATKALGIKVNIVRLASTLIFNRAVQEFDAGINR